MSPTRRCQPDDAHRELAAGLARPAVSRFVLASARWSHDFRRSEPVRLLLINPRCADSFWSFRFALTEIVPARQRGLLAYYRGRGHHVVAGGSYASLCPHKYAALADAVIAGETEYLWPAFGRDFEAGAPRPLYRETGSVDQLQTRHVAALERLLARLAHHGDRVSLVIHETLRELVRVDSSVFDLVLGERGAQRSGT